ncbi:hypothetical protein FRC03_005547 [Tulasnella sp. 419]|nr:hypothetical protein FRC03_005547 [Tulasnella sp. 419]
MPDCNTIYWTDYPSASVSFSFVGTSVSVVGNTDPRRGIYDVYLDDEYKGTVDRDSPTSLRCRIEMFNLTNLSPGVQHTFRVVLKGDVRALISSDGILEFSEFRYEAPDSINTEVQQVSSTVLNKPPEFVSPEAHPSSTPTDGSRSEVQTSLAASTTSTQVVDSTAAPSQDEGKPSSIGPIIGGVVGSVIGVGVVVTLVWFLFRRVKKREAQKVDMDSGYDDGNSGIAQFARLTFK